jgi:glycosyltransferase involved in cell wall biosynthesis
MSQRLLYVAPTAGFFLSHRLPIARAAQTAGYTVAVACPKDEDTVRLTANGFLHLHLPIGRSSANVRNETRTLRAMKRVFTGFQPDLAHLITAKPALHGGITARLAGVPTVTAVTGLGFVFIREDPRTKLMRRLLIAGYRFGLNRANNHFIFQNEDDCAVFRDNGLLRRASASIVSGSGVDLSAISPHPLPDGETVVLMPCRMLADKGVGEFIDAARILRARGSMARFILLGDPDPANPASYSISDLTAISDQGVVEWRPHTNDIGSALAGAHIIALPSYREGFPKTLIDAAAAGRSMVTTNVPGCRDAVIDGETGLLCEVRNPGSLANRLDQLIRDPAAIRRMGNAARVHAEQHFDIEQVVQSHLKIYERMLRT